MAAITNYERVGRTLDLLRQGLTPFLKRELEDLIGPNWRDRVVELFPGDANVPKTIAAGDPWDCQIALVTMWHLWNEVFKKTLGHAERSIVSELRTFRNNWAHQKQFSTDDAYRCMDSAERLLTAVSAPQAEQINSEKARLMREKFQQELRDTRKKNMLPGLEGEPLSGLSPWRDIMTPHDDVASGRFQQAEFAADLWQVYRGEARAEYGDPIRFFQRTYMTEGLKVLLGGALCRLCNAPSGNAADSTTLPGDPIVELQTNFGGGKTHSMLALYHLFSGTPFAEMVGVEELTAKVGLNLKSQAVRRAVLVGTRIAPGQPTQKEDGTVINTLWGELAWQLGGNEGYQILAEADRTASGPGEALHHLLKRYAPCLILIDEWVAYARQLHDDGALCGGSFETQFTFAQTLTETVRNVDHAMLVVSIPASDSVSPHMQTQTTDIEVGGERGFQALHRLKNVIGRIESAWRPASQEESYAIVRRRLFNDITDAKLFKQRDAVIDAFMDMYGKQAQEFPTESRESAYRRRMQACYPIHPELFDRLYNEWSSLERFQRTRGVLRLMASVIHALWDRNDAGLMILPASIPIDDPKVQPELTRYLENSWIPVIERDVDGGHSLSRRLDHENPNMGRYSACRRVARTIYMASAPTSKTPHKGADDQHVKLGCVQPGESVATFGDALRRLSDQAMHLYTDKNRFWFDTQPTVQRLARDRANDIKPDNVIEEIQRRLLEEQRAGSGFVRVHACPASHADVPDERCTRLVILGPESAHERNNLNSQALQSASAMLENRGNSPRQYRNTLVYLAADSRLMQPLDEAVRLYLAWNSINDDRGEDRLDLSAGQARQVGNQLRQSNETVTHRMHEVFCWLLAPGLSDPKGKDVEWQAIRLTGQESLAERAWKRLTREQAVYREMGGVVLRMELDRIPLWQGSHVEIDTLADYFARYLYLPRLREDAVLENAAAEGVGLLTWDADTFAFADAWDADKKRYLGLRAGVPIAIRCEAGGLLVKPEIAAAQKQAEQPPPSATPSAADTPALDGQQPEPATSAPPPPEAETASKQEPKRFFGSVKIDPTRMSRDAGKLADEVVQHLTKQLMGDVEVRIEISATAPGGYPEDVVRTVTENSRTLKFDSSGFESE